MFKPTIIFTLKQSEQVTKPKGSHDSFVEMTDEVSIFEVHSICPHMGECSFGLGPPKPKEKFIFCPHKENRGQLRSHAEGSGTGNPAVRRFAPRCSTLSPRGRRVGFC